jgi:hypothetical protein
VTDPGAGVVDQYRIAADGTLQALNPPTAATAWKVTIPWNLLVNGSRLAAGNYLITLRVLDHHGNPITLARPVIVTIAQRAGR